MNKYLCPPPVFPWVFDKPRVLCRRQTSNINFNMIYTPLTVDFYHISKLQKLLRLSLIVNENLFMFWICNSSIVLSWSHIVLALWMLTCVWGGVQTLTRDIDIKYLHKTVLNIQNWTVNYCQCPVLIFSNCICILNSIR